MKRRLFFLTLFGITAVAMYAACTIDSIQFAATGDSSTTDGGFDGSDATAPVGANEDVDPNGGDAEAGLVDSAEVDANSVDAACCDCDQDGFIGVHDAASDCGTPPPGLLDCDDYSKPVNPDAGFLQNPDWTSPHKPEFDWNCDNQTTKQLVHDLKSGCNCVSVVGLGLSCSCKYAEGFEDDPFCGVQSNYFTCTGGLGDCSYALKGSETQACK
jgi:hypothetical protein